MQSTAYRTITGQTYEARESLRRAGCRWDAARKAWVIPGELPRGQQRAIESRVYQIRRDYPGIMID